MNYDRAKIHEFLLNRFSDEEFLNLCSFRFDPVYKNFGDGMERNQKIRLLLDHCENHNRFPTLIEALKELRRASLDEIEEFSLQSSSSIQNNPGLVLSSVIINSANIYSPSAQTPDIQFELSFRVQNESSL